MITLLTNATVFTVDRDDTVLEGGWVLLDGQHIAGVGPAGSAPRTGGADRHLDLTGQAVLPGFINCHTHTPMMLFRGHAEGRNLLSMDGWFNTIRRPELVMQPEDVPAATALSCAEMALLGTTTLADQYFFADEVARAIDASGLRATVTYGIVQLGDEARGARELQQATTFVERLRDRYARVTGWLGPHAPFTDNSEALLMQEVTAAQAHGVGLHLHMAVGPEDNAWTLEHRGVTAGAALEQIGFYTARVIAAHCLDLSEADIAAFARAPQLSVAHCATAGLRSGVQAICPVLDLQAAGVNVALGTDNVANNNSYDLLAEARLAGIAASHREGRPQPVAAAQLLRMITVNGARAMGLDRRIGTLEVGKEADLIALDCGRPGYAVQPDPAAALVYAGSGRDVTHSWVAGEPLVAGGRLVRQDWQHLQTDYQQTYHRFWSRVQRAAVTT